MINQKYQAYLRKNILTNIIIKISQISIVLLFLLSWELLSYFGIINSFIFSSPSKIIITTINLFNNYHLTYHIFITLKEIIIAFSIGLSLSLIIAIIIYEIPIIARIIEPFLTIINSLPKVALGPIIIIWFGANQSSIIVMALLINLIVGILTIYNGFSEVDYNKLMLLKSMHATKFDILTMLVLKQAKNSIITALKLNISMTLIGVIMGEFLVSKAGIGYLIIYGTQIFNLNIVLSGIMILVILSSLLYIIITLYEKNSINK